MCGVGLLGMPNAIYWTWLGGSLAALYPHPSDGNLLGVLTLLVQALYPHPSDAKIARGTLKHALLVYIHVIVNHIEEWPLQHYQPLFPIMCCNRRTQLSLLYI